MIKATMRCLASSIMAMLLMLSFAADTNAQNMFYGENIVFNGDFSLGDSLWVTEGETELLLSMIHYHLT